jgi:magnesium-transporting ATPase (P-type)
VHGRWNYRRICSVIIYSFYKTIVFVFTLFLFGFYNGASGTTLYESWLGYHPQTRHSFLSFPYVCPEPVLVKCSFYI